MTTTEQPQTEPTGLDYQEAYRALYPGLVAEGVRLHDTNDQVLRLVDRAARLRAAERERVKEFVREQLPARLDHTAVALRPAHAIDVMAAVLEEIR